MGEALKMVLVCPCAASTEGLVSLCIDCVCENCLNIIIYKLLSLSRARVNVGGIW